MTTADGVPDPGERAGPCTSLPVGKLPVDLPTDVGDLVGVCQGLLVHEHLATAYGVDLDEAARRAVHLRQAQDVVDAARALDPSPITVPRDPSHRLAANCRQFTVLMVALLRATGTEARARCGFSDYFGTGRWEDHWVTEVSDPDVGWRLVDAQVDALQREVLGVDVDPLDVPRDRFLVAGDAWQRCRAGLDDPGRFGLTVLDESGLWWIAGNLMRDAASLDGLELLPWDSWGAMPGPEDEVDNDLAVTLDELAASTVDPDTAPARRARHRLMARPGLAVGLTVRNDLLGHDEPVPS